MVKKHKEKHDRLQERLTKQKESAKEVKVKLADKSSELKLVKTAFKVWRSRNTTSDISIDFKKALTVKDQAKRDAELSALTEVPIACKRCETYSILCLPLMNGVFQPAQWA